MLRWLLDIADSLQDQTPGNTISTRETQYITVPPQYTWIRFNYNRRSLNIILYSDISYGFFLCAGGWRDGAVVHWKSSKIHQFSYFYWKLETPIFLNRVSTYFSPLCHWVSEKIWAACGDLWGVSAGFTNNLRKTRCRCNGKYMRQMKQPHFHNLFLVCAKTFHHANQGEPI